MFRAITINSKEKRETVWPQVAKGVQW